MRSILSILIAGLIVSCSPVPPNPNLTPLLSPQSIPQNLSKAPPPRPLLPTQSPSSPAPETQPSKPSPQPIIVAQPTPSPSPSYFPLKITRSTLAGASFTVLSFDSREYQLSILDHQGELGTGPNSAAEILRNTNALAVINGGFFTPEGKPLGIVYEEGKPFGQFNSVSSLGTGVLYIPHHGRTPQIIRRAVFKSLLKSPHSQPSFALQTGPFLVENSRAISGLSNHRPRLRSLLLWDGQFHFALAQCDAITLQDLGQALAKQPLTHFKIKTALNLDGGRSADLSISAKVNGSPLHLRRWWNKPVRNYLILK